MRVTILTTGTRGDVQPYVALGVGLRAAGHAVRLATHARFEDFVRGRGLEFAPLAGDPWAILESETGKELLQSGKSWLHWLIHLRPLLEPLFERCLRDCHQACADAEVVVFAQATCYGSWIAEALKLPSVSAYYLPLTRTRFMPSFVFPPLPSRLGGLRERYNLLTFDVGGFLVWAPMQGIANKVRDRHFHLPPIPLGQPPWRSFPPGHPYLYGFSSAVVPRPPDWDEHKYVTGYWFLDRLPDWRPPAELVDFLDSGPPPVCVTFGSMVNTDAEEVTAGIVQALTRAGQRGLLLTGAGGLTSSFLTDDIRAFQEVPHDWLFPRVAAAVHHGGAGTSGAALRAGIPSVVVPFLGDQPFWARRLFNLGASPRPIRRKRLSPERLEAAVRVAVTDPAMRKRAARLGEQIRAEDGVGQAVAVFHRYLGLPYEPPTPAEQGRREVLTAS